MKKVVLASLLAVAGAVPSASILYAQDQPAAAPAGQIQMSPEEYKAYNDASTAPQGAAQAAAFEAYLKAYPSSAVKLDVLNKILYNYAQTGDQTKTIAAADNLLAVDPSNLRALTYEVFYKRAAADALTDPAAKTAALDKVADYAKQGLAATKPKDMPDADFTAQMKGAAPILLSAEADDYLSKKDNADAITALKTELDGVPVAATQDPKQQLQDVFVLAQAYYTSTPPDYLNCAWYATRAADFAPAAFKPQISQLATFCYNKYHGKVNGKIDGYDALVTATQTNLDPPAGFTVTPAKKPADIAADVIATTPDLATLAISDKEFILQNGKASDADKVFDTIKGKSVELPDVIVVAATADSIQVAVSDDAVQSKTADFTFTMKEPLKTLPTVGDKISLDGTYASYTQSPLMITMSDASVVAPAKKAAPKKAAPVHHTTH